MTRFGLIRHFPTLFNLEKRIQGTGDSPLAPGAEEKAALWRPVLAGLDFDRCLSSDLGRARATARLLAEPLGLDPAPDSRLREQDWGRWSGRSLARIREQEGEELDAQIARGWDFTPPGGESRLAVWERASAALNEAARAHAGQTLLVVCHEGVIKALCYRLEGRAFLPSEAPRKILPAVYWVLHGPEGLAIGDPPLTPLPAC